MQRIAPSLYSYENDCNITETTINEEPQDYKPSRGEVIVIAILKKYGFLTTSLIQRLMNLHGHAKLNALKILRKMQQQKKMQKFTISFNSERQDINIYVLPRKIRTANKVRNQFKYDMTDIPYVLEHLSVTQWHISVLEGSKAKEIYAFKQINQEGFIAQIPSLIEVRTKLGTRMNLCALPVPKGVHKQDLGRLFTNIITIDKYLGARKDRFKAYVIVLICESESQIEEVSLMLREMGEIKEIYILYSIDVMTSEENLDPLKIMYDVNRAEGETKLEVCRLRD